MPPVVPDPPLLERLFANHLAFARTHHGAVERRDGMVLVDGGRPEFVYAVLEDVANVDAIPERFHAIRLLPWSRLVEADVLACGFAYRASLGYMTLASDADLEASSDVAIERVTSSAAMDVFSDVQTRGFLAPGDSFDAWYAWLRARNEPSLLREERRFYVASREGKPAGVLFTLLEQETLGIYGVATLPSQRKRGTSTALLGHAVREGRARGARTVTLQVQTGSYAESFYANLGFETAFVSRIFVRPSPGA
jgi:GNAT superfamily N-acetyltransferase